MKEIELNSWEQFETEVIPRAEKLRRYNPLFRGQRKSDWKLETTLERYLRLHGVADTDYSTEVYYQNIIGAAAKVETVTGKRWQLTQNFEKEDGYSRSPQGYEFMVFLRQNGFPSPLLDWTRSPYVAAFFAFHHANSKEDKFAAIFEYTEFGESGKLICPGEATIEACGSWIATDKRHFLQQSEYTVCREQKNNECVYASHEKVFARGNEEQDILIKYLIPSGEHEKILRKLQLMNITSYSLFETTESLLELIASDLRLLD